jgi:hypothetical protein
MRDLDRRSFLGAALAAFPLTVLGQSTESSAPASTPVKAALVPHGEDREGEHHSVGISTTDFKVTTQDSGGALFLFEHNNHKKGGPPRHCTTTKTSGSTRSKEITSSRSAPSASI